MLHFLFHQCQAVATNYDICFYESDQKKCQSSEAGGTLPSEVTAKASKQFSSYGWPTAPTGTLYIAESITVNDDAYTGLAGYLLTDTDFQPTDKITLASGVLVTLTLSKQVTIAGTLALPGQYVIKDCTDLIVTGLCTINPALVTTSKITINGGLVLLFAEGAQDFKNLFSTKSPLFVVSDGQTVKYTFKTNPEKVTLRESLSFSFPGPIVISTDIPTAATTITNAFAALNLEIPVDTTQAYTFSVVDASSSSIAVTSTLSSLTKKITITTLVNNVPTYLPLNLASLAAQSFFTKNAQLLFKSTTEICVYHQGETTAQCANRQAILDTDKTIIADFLDGKTSVMFIKAQLDAEMFKDLVFTDNVKWVCTSGLIIGVKAILTKNAVTFPDSGVSFGDVAQALTVTTFEAPISSIAKSSATGKIIVSTATIKLDESTAVSAFLGIFGASTKITLQYSDSTKIELTATPAKQLATVTINSKDITISHDITISSLKPIASFQLTWPKGNAPGHQITLRAEENTKFSLGKDFASADSLVNVDFKVVPQVSSVSVSCFSAISTTPFTNKQKITFSYIVENPICVYHTGSSAECNGGGIEDSQLKQAEVSAATSIAFKGACSIDIDVFVPHLDFSSDFYEYTGTLSLTVQNTATTYAAIVLGEHSTLKSAIKAASLKAPIASIDVGISPAAIEIPLVTLILATGTNDISSTVAQFKDATITFSLNPLPTTLAFTNVNPLQVTYGGSSFTYSSGQKYIFGDAPATEMTVTTPKLGATKMPKGTFSLPVTATTKITIMQSQNTDVGYLTLTGIAQKETLLLVVVAAKVTNEGPLIGDNLLFKYVVKDTSYCFVSADSGNPECFAITQKVNAQGFTGELLQAASYIRVVGQVTCDVSLFTVTKTVTFPSEEIFDFVALKDGHPPALALSNTKSTILTSLTVIDNVHIAGTIEAATINAPIESLPTDSSKITTSEANILISVGNPAQPTQTAALSSLLAKSGILVVNLKVKDTDKLVLTYDSTTSLRTFCYNQLKGFTGPINFQSASEATSFNFDVVGQTDAIAGTLKLGSVAVTTGTRLSLGKGFDKAQQKSLLSLSFGTPPVANVPVYVPTTFNKANLPFVPLEGEFAFDYKFDIANICLYVKSAEETCTKMEGYSAYTTETITSILLTNAQKVFVAEAMEIDIEKFADSTTSVVIKSNKFTLTGKLTLQITKSKTFTSVEIELGMNVAIVIKEPPPPPPPAAQILEPIVPTFTTLNSEAKIVNTLKGTIVGTWNLFVDPADANTYMIIDDANIKVGTQCNFQVKGTDAKIVFKPSDSEGQSAIVVCSSTYSWPTSAIAFASTSSSEKLSQVDVDFVPTDKAKVLTAKFNVDLSDNGKLKILEGLSDQKENPFTVSASTYSVIYPSTFKPEDYFIKEGDGVSVDTWSPTQPNPPPEKSEGLAGWAIAVIVIVVVIVVAVVVVLVLNFTGVIHLCGNRDDAPSV